MPDARVAKSGECDNDLCMTLLPALNWAGGGGGGMFGNVLSIDAEEAVARHRRAGEPAAESRPKAFVVWNMV